MGMSHYQPVTGRDREEMLGEIGVSSLEELFADIPLQLRSPKIDLPPALSELEIQSHLRSLGGKNIPAAASLSFLGGGSYDHFIPAAVYEIARREEFYTAYTPYQAEASQGTLQAIFEYQSLMTELTGMDVSNASHYDGATSMAEAALLAFRYTGRREILVSRAVHPHYREVLNTYLRGTPYTVKEFGFSKDKTFDREEFVGLAHGEIAGAIFQSPNFFGVIEDLDGVSDKLHGGGGLLILASNPLALGVLKPPAQWGADVAVGEGQPLGIPMQFGGPYLGYFATTRALMRQIPGRLCGMTQDGEGRRAFCLTIQAREQHIRRERAASNICTNQALCALMACIYMTLLGKRGLREVGELNLDRAAYLRDKIAKIPGFSCDLKIPIFNEFVVRTPRPPASIEEQLIKKHILPGIALSRFYPELRDEMLVCATETKTRGMLDSFVEELARC